MRSGVDFSYSPMTVLSLLKNFPRILKFDRKAIVFASRKFFLRFLRTWKNFGFKICTQIDREPHIMSAQESEWNVVFHSNSSNDRGITVVHGFPYVFFGQ